MRKECPHIGELNITELRRGLFILRHMHSEEHLCSKGSALECIHYQISNYSVDRSSQIKPVALNTSSHPTCTYLYIHVYLYILLHSCTYFYILLYTCTYLYIPLYTYTCTYFYIHTIYPLVIGIIITTLIVFFLTRCDELFSSERAVLSSGPYVSDISSSDHTHPPSSVLCRRPLVPGTRFTCFVYLAWE